MLPFKPRQKPEKKIVDALKEFLVARDWFVLKTHGSEYSMGWPDLYATHKYYKARWIEVKNPKAFSFTKAQIATFPSFISNGSPIWVLTAATEEEYAKLFKESNYWQFCKF